LDFLLKKIYIN